MDHICRRPPPPRFICEIEAARDRKDMATYGLEVTDFHSEVRFDLQGCLEAALTSEVTKSAFTSNMHRDIFVIEVNDFKSEVRFNL